MKFWNWLVHGEEREKETEFLPAILEVTETPPSPTGRLVMWSILLLLVIGLVWAFLGHINEVAVANGKVIPSGQAKTVQVKNKGIIKEIRESQVMSAESKKLLSAADKLVRQGNNDIIRRILKLGQAVAEQNTLIPFTQEEFDAYLEEGIARMVADVQMRQGKPRVYIGINKQ